MIENVEGFGAELHAYPLSEFYVFEQGEIPALHAWTED